MKDIKKKLKSWKLNAKKLADNIETCCGERECPLCGYSPEKFIKVIERLAEGK